MSPIPGVTGSSDGRQPDTPTIGTATAGITSGSIAFTAPVYLGKPNTNNIYTATASPGGLTGTGTASPITISGLTAGQAYTATITLSTRTSTNTTIATSLSSAASNSFTPTAPPFFPFFPPAFGPSFPFFPPFFPPSFPFFPPFFPPSFPFFPPFFPPSFPYFPKFKGGCIYAKSKIFTTAGYINAEDISVGDKLLTVSLQSLSNVNLELNTMSIFDNVEFTEVEVTTSNMTKQALIKFNDIEEMFSEHQPIYVKTEFGLKYKNSNEIILGDMLVRIDSESGNVSYTEVTSIEHINDENTYEIRTTPYLWFIVGNSLVVS